MVKQFSENQRWFLELNPRSHVRQLVALDFWIKETIFNPLHIMHISTVIRPIEAGICMGICYGYQTAEHQLRF